MDNEHEMTSPEGLPPPSPSVLAAFGVSGTPTKLSGGQGENYLVMPGTVFKHYDDIVEAEFILKVQDLIHAKHNPAYRIPRPLRCQPANHNPNSTIPLNGYVYEGWTAATYLQGTQNITDPPHVTFPAIIAAARAFHADLDSLFSASDDFVALEAPSAIRNRTHKWARADRTVWSKNLETETAKEAIISTVAPQFRAALRQVVSWVKPLPSHWASYAKAQLVHGDLSGNVLFADATSHISDLPECGCPDASAPPSSALAPAIIDFSPYWRPAAYAEAVIVADGLEAGDGGEIVQLYLHEDEADDVAVERDTVKPISGNTSKLSPIEQIQLRTQLLLRALMFRLLSDGDPPHVETAPRSVESITHGSGSPDESTITAGKWDRAVAVVGSVCGLHH